MPIITFWIFVFYVATHTAQGHTRDTAVGAHTSRAGAGTPRHRAARARARVVRAPAPGCTPAPPRARRERVTERFKRARGARATVAREKSPPFPEKNRARERESREVDIYLVNIQIINRQVGGRLIWRAK